MEKFGVSNLAIFNEMIRNIDLVVCVKTYVRNIKILNPELVGSSPNDKRSYKVVVHRVSYCNTFIHIFQLPISIPSRSCRNFLFQN